MSVKDLKKTGYEFLWQSVMSTDALWLIDGTVYFTKKHKLENAQVAEIIGVSEIRKGAKLTGLLLRYRVNGLVNEAKIGGSGSHLLTMMDKLGYGS